MPAFGYIRKSRMEEDSPTQSPAVQEERIRDLAKARGENDELVILRDLNVSGGTEMEDRPHFAEIVAAIRDGTCSAVYAFDLSRLFRNLKEQMAFFEMTTAKGIPVRLANGDVGEVSGATGKLMLDVLGAMNEWQRTNTSEKIKATMSRKRANGEPLGGRRYGEVRTITTKVNGVDVTRMAGEGEDATAVVEAYRAEGSFYRAAKRLDAATVPTRNRKSRGWSPSAVRAVVTRLAPDLVIDRRADDRLVRGSRTTARAARFGRVLRCSVCDSMLTPSYDAKRDTWRYYCHGSHRPGHGRKWLTESAIIRAITPEVEGAAAKMARLRVAPDGRPPIDTDALRARRERYVEMYGEGLISKERRDEVIREVDGDLARAASLRRVRRFTIPPNLIADTPERVNTWMRDTFARIVVDMTSVGKRGVSTDVAIAAEWIDPAMRDSAEPEAFDFGKIVIEGDHADYIER